MEPVFIIGIIFYSSTMASVGHSLAHVPQLMQVSASMTLFPSFSLIAPTGQSGSHVPQFIHLSVILYAM
jgi:hypothetical protein